MKYIAQAFTGGFNYEYLYDKNYIFSSVKNALDILNIDSLIIGWNKDKSLYKDLVNYILDKGKKVYLWLPVFSEASSLKKTIGAIDFNGREHKNVSAIEGEDFSFSCPSDETNINNAKEIYEEYFSDIPFSGVFLDKIRYSSFGNGFESAMGCFCEKCKSSFEKYEADVNAFTEKLKSKENKNYLLPNSIKDGAYAFLDELTNKIFTARAKIITNSVVSLIDYFHSKNMEAALDVYAPLFSYYVGQDIASLSQHADFIKPMVYRITNAPAGIPYEYESLKKEFLKHDVHVEGVFEKLWESELVSDKCFESQIKIKNKAKCPIYFGFEVNYKKGICESSQEYIENSVNILKKNKADGSVLSWDILSGFNMDAAKKIMTE